MNLKLLNETLASEPAYRAKQVWEWTARGAASYDEMTNLPAALRDALDERVPVLLTDGGQRVARARRDAEGALRRPPTAIPSRPC